jgi:hypothetical protein
MVERNAGVAPDKRIDFRVGIHLGARPDSVRRYDDWGSQRV